MLPHQTSEVDYEAELGVVIGKPARRVPAENALEHVAGYVCANDVSARDVQFADGQWTRGKSFDTFCPVGPMVPAAEIADPQNLRIRCLVNGEALQDGSTADMIFGVAELIAYISDGIDARAGRPRPHRHAAGRRLRADAADLPRRRRRGHGRDRGRRLADEPGPGRVSVAPASVERALRDRFGAEVVSDGVPAAYLADATEARGLSGHADAVVLPRHAEEVAEVVAWCYEQGVPITPRGGGTGFAGGAVPFGGVVLGLERVRRVRSLDPLLWRMEAEAGVTTADVRRLARENGLLFPPDPGAAEQSQIGGNVATNAGGPHAFKYGVTGDWVTGVEVVVAPGELVRVGGPIRKDVAGYDLGSLARRLGGDARRRHRGVAAPRARSGGGLARSSRCTPAPRRAAMRSRACSAAGSPSRRWSTSTARRCSAPLRRSRSRSTRADSWS